MKPGQPRSLTCVMLGLCMVSCTSTEDEDLRVWMDKVQHETTVSPVPAPHTLAIQSVTYDPSGKIDPFDNKKISVSLLANAASGPLPDPQRLREPLEAYPLESLRMVGSLRRQGEAIALIEADKILYQVRKGHRLGQDHGTVIRIQDAAIEIEEIVQEAPGSWATRKVQLSIQGKQ